jgi:hypothetical protein
MRRMSEHQQLERLRRNLVRKTVREAQDAMKGRSVLSWVLERYMLDLAYAAVKQAERFWKRRRR